MAAQPKNPDYKTSRVTISLRQDQILALGEIKPSQSSRSGVVRDAIDNHLNLTPPPEYLDTE